MNKVDRDAIARIVREHTRTFYVGGHVPGLEIDVIDALADYMTQDAAKECHATNPKTCLLHTPFDREAWVAQAKGE